MSKKKAARKAASSEVQVIHGDGGTPAFAVVPWARWQSLVQAEEESHDAAIADMVKADLAAGRQELLPATMVERLLAGEAPIRVWREHRGLTQAQLATASGLKQGYISELESGRKANPSLEALNGLARALHCRLDDLVVDTADS